MSQETTNKAGGVSFIGLLGLVIGATIASAVFAFPGDFAAAGAGSGAVLVGWLITGIGMLGLCLAFYYLNKLKPELKGGVYSYARAGFGSYVGFNSAWGYWLSELLSNISFLTLLFASVGQFLPLFGVGNNIPSVIGMSVVWWIAIILVLRGTKESTAVNLVSTIAKIIPILVLIVVIIFARAFSFETFMQNFSGSEGGMTNEELAALGNPPMAGILEHVVGPWGAALVNIAVIISLLGATLGHTIMCTECPYEAAKSGAFCKAFTRTNKNGAPVFAIVLTSIIAQVFLVLLYFNESTYQVFYFFATGMIMVPYFLSAMYFCKVALKQENGLIKGIGIFNAVYAVWMVFAAGISVMLATVLLYVPGIFVYAKGQKEKGLKVFETKVDKAVFVALLALLVICIYFVGTGRINPLG